MKTIIKLLKEYLKSAGLLKIEKQPNAPCCYSWSKWDGRVRGD